MGAAPVSRLAIDAAQSAVMTAVDAFNYQRCGIICARYYPVAPSVVSVIDKMMTDEMHLTALEFTDVTEYFNRLENWGHPIELTALMVERLVCIEGGYTGMIEVVYRNRLGQDRIRLLDLGRSSTDLVRFPLAGGPGFPFQRKVVDATVEIDGGVVEDKAEFVKQLMSYDLQPGGPLYNARDISSALPFLVRDHLVDFFHNRVENSVSLHSPWNQDEEDEELESLLEESKRCTYRVEVVMTTGDPVVISGLYTVPVERFLMERTHVSVPSDTDSASS